MTSEAAGDRWLTYREVGQLLGVGERAALNWVKEHDLPVAPGRPARVPLAAVVAQAAALKRPLAALPNDSEPASEAPSEALPHTSEASRTDSEPIEADFRATPAAIEQAVTRTAAQYAGDMRAIFERVDALYADQLTAKDEALAAREEVIAAQRDALAELRRRAEAAEAERRAVEEERDALRLQLAEATVPPVVVVAAQDTPEGQQAIDTTLAAHRPSQSFWRRLTQRWRLR